MINCLHQSAICIMTALTITSLVACTTSKDDSSSYTENQQTTVKSSESASSDSLFHSFRYQSSLGALYYPQKNKDGIILINENSEKLYLGKDCDAYSTKYGKGSWFFANGGFSAEFSNNQTISFPRQDITLGFKESDKYNCQI